MLQSINILHLIQEVCEAKNRAQAIETAEFTLGERLDFHRAADQAAALRFDAVAQSYGEQLRQHADYKLEVKKQLRKLLTICELHKQRKTIVPVSTHDVLEVAAVLGFDSLSSIIH